MPASWKTVEIGETFSDPLSDALAGLHAKIKAASTPPIRLATLQFLVLQHKEVSAFNTDCQSLYKNIGKISILPSPMGLNPLMENGQLVENFYTVTAHGWVGYFHIDNRFSILTSVYVRRASDTQPASIGNKLRGMIEKFRSTP